MDDEFNLIATYIYDSWGKVLSVRNENGEEVTNKNHIANINPFRYRSYYYDNETGLYYLNSRYYNPEIGRFINADETLTTSIDTLVGHNMYAYSNNNPINYYDSDGNFPWAIIGAVVVGSLLTRAITKIFGSIGNSIFKGAKKAKDLTSLGKQAKSDVENHVKNVVNIGSTSKKNKKITKTTIVKLYAEPVQKPKENYIENCKLAYEQFLIHAEFNGYGDVSEKNWNELPDDLQTFAISNVSTWDRMVFPNITTYYAEKGFVEAVKTIYMP